MALLQEIGEEVYNKSNKGEKMEENKGGLVPVSQTRLPAKTKETLQKIGKISKHTLLALGFEAAAMVSYVFFPIALPPTVAGFVYHAQKVINNTVYKSEKDLAFITRKGRNNTIKIFQDWTRNDIAKEIKNFSDIEKAAFLELQAIIGVSRMQPKNKNGETIQYATRSHGPVRKAFKKLAELGYIENYQEEFDGKSRIVLPKLAFRNLKGLKEKQDMYHISFNATGKEMDVSDPFFQRKFLVLFGKNGFISKRGYEIMPDGKGGLTYKVSPKTLVISPKKLRNPLKRKLRGEELPSYEQQAENSRKFTEEESQKDGKDKDGKEIE